MILQTEFPLANVTSFHHLKSSSLLTAFRGPPECSRGESWPLRGDLTASSLLSISGLPTRSPHMGNSVHGNSGKKRHLTYMTDGSVLKTSLLASSPQAHRLCLSESPALGCGCGLVTLQVQCVTLDSGSQRPPPHPVSSVLLSSRPC